MGKYKIMTGKELGDYIYKMLKQKKMIDISFWSDYELETAESEIDDINFSGAYGIKNISIFDEERSNYPSLLTIGYWGGGTTKVLDCTIDYDKKEVVTFINNYINDWCNQTSAVVEFE